MALQTAALPWRINNARKPEVMLVTGRRSQRWIVPKGWPMAGKSLADAAAQEAFEEAGIDGAIDPRPLGSFRQIKRSWFGSVEVEILVHPLAVERELPEWPEKRQRSRQWFSLKDAMSRVESDELRHLIASLGRRLRQELKAGGLRRGPAV